MFEDLNKLLQKNMLHAGVHNAPPLLHGYTKRVVYPYPVRIRYGYALDTPRIRSRPYPKILDTYWYGYVYPIRGPNHQTAQYSTLL